MCLCESELFWGQKCYYVATTVFFFLSSTFFMEFLGFIPARNIILSAKNNPNLNGYGTFFFSKVSIPNEGIVFF